MPAGPSRIVNPMLAVPDDDGGIELDTDMSAADMIEANESAMTEEELADLTYAFREPAAALYRKPCGCDRPSHSHVAVSLVPLHLASTSELLGFLLLDSCAEAADMGGDGAIDVCEFSTMLRVMGCDITEEQAKHVIAEAKEGVALLRAGF
eukprot:SAG31_NODE_15_length_37942_cov_32.078297_31_plen_151_part_00